MWRKAQCGNYSRREWPRLRNARVAPPRGTRWYRVMRALISVKWLLDQSATREKLAANAGRVNNPHNFTLPCAVQLPAVFGLSNFRFLCFCLAL